ncbi:MAG TPA: ABC transporter substrate-binding protein [Acidimicrobiales bacterium]|nr:ABC transporter substrate-binding protein [Acidimicrobiales bacterium]
MTLRQGATWQDGKPFTPEDVAFSYEFYKKQEGASGRYAHHVSDVPAYERAEVVDSKTIKLFFSQPAPQFKIMPGADLPIIAKHIFEAIPDPAKATTNLPVGTGPFRLVEIVPDQRYKLEANQSYFKGKPRIDRLELVIIKDPGGAFTALRTGDVDMVERNVPGELVDQLKGTSGVGVAEGTRFESIQLYFNARKKPLSDAKLRKAMSMGINLDNIVKTVLLGRARPVRDTYLHPDSPWVVKYAGHQFDPQAAAKMLDDAGYSAKDPDGVRKAPDGTRLEFSILVNSFEPLDLRATQLIATQMQGLGIKYKVESLDPATLRSRRSPAPGQTIPPYDAYVSNLESHAHVDPDALYYFLHSPGKGPDGKQKGFGGSITGYTNPEFDKLVERASVAEAPERRRLLADIRAVEDVSLTVEEGEVVALVGESGAGKSTLARLMLGLEKPDEGSVRFDGLDLGALSGRELRKARQRMHLVLQDPYQSLHPGLRVSSLVGEPLGIRSVSRADRAEPVTKGVEQVALRPAPVFCRRFPPQLSGGQRQRVALARALVAEPKLVIADEPTSMLDASLCAGILELILDIRDRFGTAFVYITHDLALARWVSDRMVVMRDGRIEEIGPSDDVVNCPGSDYTKLLLAASDGDVDRMEDLGETQDLPQEEPWQGES